MSDDADVPMADAVDTALAFAFHADLDYAAGIRAHVKKHASRSRASDNDTFFAMRGASDKTDCYVWDVFGI